MSSYHWVVVQLTTCSPKYAIDNAQHNLQHPFSMFKHGLPLPVRPHNTKARPHHKHMHTAITGGSGAPKGRDPGCRSKCSIASLRALTRGPDKRCLIFVIVSPLSTDCPGETIAMIKKHCWFRCPVRPLLFKRIKCIVILKRLPVPTTGAGLQCQ